MFNRIINAIAGNYNENEIKKILPSVRQINTLCDEFDALSDEQVKQKTDELKGKIANGSSLDDIMIEAFAVVKQACKRLVGTTYTVKWWEQVWNMVPYDVQIVGGINLHKGKISEMKTGEGKTLVATMPAYLNALSGNGVHIVTVNDYLASRDSDQMKVVFEYLWLSVWCVVKETPLHIRREEYSKDITYVENSELGFDYLRDNLTKSMRERHVLRRPLNYAIVDEIDSILIDESRTPLIISEPDAEPTEKYAYYAQIITMLTPSKKKKKVSKWFLHDMLNDTKKDWSDEEDYGDYYVDEKTKSVALSSEGIAKLERILNVENLYKDIGYEEIHHIENALKANACYQDGKEYLINNGEVLIIDENTGRAQPGRRFSQWLHQAIEAKEKVTIQKESKTLATITYQNFFKLYKKLSGMTGTATTEGEEFDSIYNLHVLAIPTNKEVIRVDKNDKVYFNQHAKWRFVTEHIAFAHEMGQPLLIGTSSIQTSEFMSSLLTKQNIVHSVLNAKFHEQEAQIISRAGKYGSVVVATNMAGRGTDIKLEQWLNERLAKNYALRLLHKASWNDNNTKGIVTALLYSQKEFDLTIDALQNISFGQRSLSEETIIASYKSEQYIWEYSLKITLNTKKKNPWDIFTQITIKHKDSSIENSISKEFHYGLGIIWTEKHESRRIDNQLRWRAWRQWDPGSSVFYVALDDSIMRKMWWEKIQWVASLLLPKSELEWLELTQSQFTSSIIRAQKQMEGRHFGIRKHLFDYDSVIDKQRQSVYKKRDTILTTLEHQMNESEKIVTTDIDTTVLDSIVEFIEPTVIKFLENQRVLWISQEEIGEVINREFWLQLTLDHMTDSFYHTTANHISQHIISKLNNAKEILWEDMVTQICSNIYLNTIDKNRVEHIDDMQYLREKVGLMWYAQLDPLVIYKKESFEKYQALLDTIHTTTVIGISNIDFEQVAQRISAAQEEYQSSFSITDQNDTTEENIIEKLKSASKDIPQNNPNNNEKWNTTMNSSDEFEIIDISENNQITSSTTRQITKFRPNDKINVRYTDGKMVRDVKYKTVKEDIQSGKCQIV